MSTHKEYWCKKDEKAINYHYNDAMGEILPFVVAGFMVIGLIVYRIRLGRKDQRLPSPFQKANLKQGLVFGQQVPFTLLKESSIFPKSHPDMELVYGELFERLYAPPLGSPDRSALELFRRYAKTSYQQIGVSLEKCQKFELRGGHNKAEILLNVSRNESFPNLRFHEQFIKHYNLIENFCRELYQERDLRTFNHSPLWNISAPTALYFYVESRPGYSWNRSDFGSLSDHPAVQAVLYPYEKTYSAEKVFKHQPTLPSFLILKLFPEALKREGLRVWSWQQAYFQARKNWWGLSYPLEQLLKYLGESANFYQKFQNWDDQSLTEVLLDHIQRFPTLENLRFLRDQQQNSEPAKKAYKTLKSSIHSVSGEITLSKEDHQGNLSSEGES